jgi:hypothetical protein
MTFLIDTRPLRTRRIGESGLVTEWPESVCS